jgi:hypothetical protein
MSPSFTGAPARIAFESFVLLVGTLLAGQSVFAAPPELAPVPVTIVAPLPVPVTPATGSLSVRDVDNAARSPFQVSLCTSAAFAGGSLPSCGNLQNSAQVPSNRRTVIEYISGDCVRSGDITLIQISLGNIVGGIAAQHPVRFALNPLDSRFLEAAQPVRIYADAGTFVGLGSSLSSNAVPGSVRCTLTLSGHTVAN